MTTPRMLLGPYGNGKVGLKTAFPGFNVTVTADDNNADRRSFNSEWPDLMKVFLFGFKGGLTSGVPVFHGLGYTPYYDARLYNPNNHTFYDDCWTVFTSGPTTSMNGALQSDINASRLFLRTFGNAPIYSGTYLIWKRQIGT